MSNKSSDFWYYTRNERRATIVLFLAVIAVFLLPAVYRFLPEDELDWDAGTFQEAIQAFETSQIDTTARHTAAADAFYFDPNTVSEEALSTLGLPAATIHTILKYRHKGGRFKEAGDLARIYNLDTADFVRLQPYIRIAARTGAVAASPTKPIPRAPELFPFDPNTVAEADLAKLGLPAKVIKNLLRYREKGGQFRTAQDLEKIYGLAPADFARLAQFIQIGETTLAAAAYPPAAQRAVPVSYEAPAPRKIDVNLATAEEWQQLYGIGPVLSGRIVKFREKLGGFVHIDQVAETFGLADSTFQAIRPHLQFSASQQLIPINTIGVEQLKEHPYVKWQQADVIIAYRREHGPYNNLDDLRQVRALTEEFIARIAPYLQFNPVAN